MQTVHFGSSVPHLRLAVCWLIANAAQNPSGPVTCAMSRRDRALDGSLEAAKPSVDLALGARTAGFVRTHDGLAWREVGTACRPRICVGTSLLDGILRFGDCMLAL